MRGARLSILISVWLCGLAVPTQAAQEIYFTALVAPAGSISQPGALTPTVYLRWNEVEGALPEDLVTFILKRDTNTIVELAANAVKSGSEINNLYQGPSQERRRNEITRSLREEMERGGNLTTNPVTNLGAAIHERLLSLSGSYWGHLASRTDFNIAQARHRAYIDPGATGAHTYELIARSNLGVEKRIGLASVNLLAVSTVIPTVTDLRPVRLARCDAPEMHKDHGTVALNWSHPGVGPGNRYAWATLIAGYDLYHTTSALSLDPDTDPAPPRDLRALASGLPHDADGNVSFPGLEKVNDRPIVISGSAERETTKKAFNAPFSQFMEKAEALRAAGLEPGDVVAYYLVARDITGNYGATAGQLVRIPDLLKPPRPWGVQTVSDTANNTFKLEWDQINLSNFQSDFNIGRRYCHIDRSRVEFVLPEHTCDDPRISVNLDVTQYIVYRFDDARDAERFTDVDGDGFSDRDERVLSSEPNLPGDPSQWTEPGTACDPTASPVPASVNYRVGTVLASSFVNRRGRQVIQYQDTDPNSPVTRKSDVFWYRIAAKSDGGQISDLSQPIRALFRDRTQPEREDKEAFHCGIPDCTYSVQELFLVTDPNVPYAIDSTPSGLAHRVEVACDPSDPDALSYLLPVVDEVTPGTRGAVLSPAMCAQLVAQCGSPPWVSYIDESGSVLATSQVPFGFCPPYASELQEDCDPSALDPLVAGAVLPCHLAPRCEFPAGTPEDEGIPCVSIMRHSGGSSWRLQMVCPGDPPVDLCSIPNLGGELVRLSLALHNENNVVSARWRLPPFRVVRADTGTAPPQPIEIRLNANDPNGEIVWLPPQQPIVGTILEWSRRGGGFTRSTFVAHTGEIHEDGTRSLVVELTPPPVEQAEEWCFRGRSVGRSVEGGEAGALSDWSAERCAIRLPAGESPPVFLSWPELPIPSEDPNDPLEGIYWRGDGATFLLLSENLYPLFSNCFPDIPFACVDPNNPCFGLLHGTVVLEGSSCASHCATISAVLDRAAAGFVAYRQSREREGAPESEFIQVSPLIERGSCEPLRSSEGGVWIRDPRVQLVEFSGGHPWFGLRLLYVDLFHHIGGREYRYQFVHFSGDGEITGYRTSGWILAD
jgi:hypothetical protein